MKSEVLLRDVEPGDLPLFFEHQRDPVAVALVVFRSRERLEFDKHWAKILADETALTKTIVADGQVAGHIASFLRDGEREIGYWIDRALWGRGIASAAVSAFLRLEQRRPLVAGVARHNLASRRVLEKCGFAQNSIDQEPEASGESHIILRLSTHPGTWPSPELLDPARLSAAIREPYHNRSLTTVNDHEVRLSVMTERFRWHRHPDSDEVFMVIEGGLIIEFDDREVLLRPGQMMTVAAGVRHCTRPEGTRSVNLTIERRDAATAFDE